MKRFIKIFISLFILIGGFIVSMLYLGGCFNNRYYNPSINLNGTKFISERTFSLKFSNEIEGKQSVYGTGWILGHEMGSHANNNEKQIYYIATNLHVASAINNSKYNSKTYYELTNKHENNNEKEWISSNIVEYNYLSLGQVVTFINNNEYIPGTIEQFTPQEDTFYDYYIDIKGENKNDPNDDNVTIEYTTFDLFNKMQLNDNGISIYNDEIVKNASQDLAILKIDFSKRKSLLKNEYNPRGDMIKKTLLHYDNFPTKFAKSYSRNEKITIGGFPYSSNLLTGNAKWNSIPYVANDTNSYIKPALEWKLTKDWNKYTTGKDIETIKKHYFIENSIRYITDDYASQINVSLQTTFDNVNIGEGGSGSMAINENNEVIGIYWGTYNITSNGVKKVVGVVDLFSNENDIKINSKNPNENKFLLKKYNIIDDIKNHIKTICIGGECNGEQH